MISCRYQTIIHPFTPRPGIQAWNNYYYRMNDNGVSLSDLEMFYTMVFIVILVFGSITNELE
jgi:hypothetical protein